MITATEANAIVEKWIAETGATNPDGPQMISSTIEKRYGWFFGVQDPRFVTTGNLAYKRYGGIHNLVVTKVDGKLHFIGGKRPSLKEWEETAGAVYVTGEPKSQDVSQKRFRQ